MTPYELKKEAEIKQEETLPKLSSDSSATKGAPPDNLPFA